MPSERATIPLVILAGSDPEPARLPESGAGKHPLRGPKGLGIEIGGRPLIDILTDRLAAIERFDPILVAGPGAAYGERRGRVRVIDTDGSFGENIRAAVEAVRRDHPGRPVAFTVCDILPDAEEVTRLLDDYEAHEPLDFWFPLILAPDRATLGASSWKPRYGMAVEPGSPALEVLPGHLIIVDPEALRLEFIYRSFELAYRSRNRSVFHRFFFMVTHLLLHLLRRDAQRLLRLRPPWITPTIVYQAAVISTKLARRTMTSEELARRYRLIYVRSEHRRRYPDRRGRLPLMPGLTLAKDVDTREEAEELAREFPRPTPGEAS